MMKKCIALCLTLIMVASCGLSVFADSFITPITQEYEGSLERANNSIDFDYLLGNVKPRSVVFTPITITEKTDGQWTEDANGTYYQYNWQQYLCFSVTFSNGATQTYTDTQFVYRGKVYNLAFTDSQSFQTPWTAGNTYSVDISVGDVTGTMDITIAPGEELPGDCNGNGEVNNEDVIYLLWYTLFPESYELQVSADFTNDGQITNEDVIYLLWHTLFPENYPV